MSRSLKLYSGTRNASSWAMRAWLALREAGLEFSEEIVDIRFPQRFANLARLEAFSPTASVPALVTDAGVIFDSLAIMEYANDRCGGALLPADLELRGRARSLLAWQHAGLSRICARISFESAFYPLKRPLTEAEQREAQRVFRTAEDLLAETGGPYLYGELSLADLALVPTIVRLTRHAADLAPFPRARAWVAAVLERPAMATWLAEADALEHVWYDEYLTPGAAWPG